MNVPLVGQQTIDLKWQNLSVQVVDPRDKKNKSYKFTLENCTGYVTSGQTLAIMGPSGAGKTTLLNLLGKRIEKNKKNNIQGEAYLNNNTYNSTQFSNNAAFILQDDILMETLTVRETIEFAAKMKLSCSAEQIQQKVDYIISKLKLDDCQNNFVGGVYVKGISGGEKKRTNIGVELVTDPKLILLDEPTSGLDSFTALLLINLLKQMAQQEGRTIIYTIHQPSSEIYYALDRILLLKDGQTVYQGKANQVVSYLEANNVEFPKYCNPADYFMYILSSKESNNSVLTQQMYYQNMQKQIQQEIESLEGNQNEFILERKSINSPFYEIQNIAKRSFINFKRNPALFSAKLKQLVVICILVSTLWWQIGKKQPSIDSTDQDKIIQWIGNITGLLFFISMSIFMNVMMTYVLLFPSERNIFLKEENSNTYRVSSYFFGKLIVEIPYVIIYPLIFCSVVYWLTSLRTEGFGIACFILVVVSLTGNGLGLMTGSMFSNPSLATAMAPLLLLPFVLFGGFYSNLNKLPAWVSWIQYISPFKYSLNALLVNQLNGEIFEKINYDPVKTFGFNLTLWQALGILICLALSMNCLSLVFLKLRTQKLN